MKKNILTLAMLIAAYAAQAQVGIGTNTPDANSVLELKSNSKGFLKPRMNTAERTTIAAPATGLEVYDTDTNSSWYYNGTIWINTAPAADGWNLTGNAGTDPLTNFIGTTDGQPLLFKISNIQAGKLETSNTSLGFFSLNNLTSGSANTAVGNFSMQNSNNGSHNTVLGFQTLSGATPGDNNTALGSMAMSGATGGSLSVAVGSQTLSSNSGIGNIGIGFQAGNNGDGAGNYNTALGYGAGASSGDYNLALGYQVFSSGMSVTGSNNIALGNNAGQNMQSGSNNIMIGQNTGVADGTANDQLNIGNAIFGTGLSSTDFNAPAGNIGIGTSAPLTTLHVNGTQLISEPSASLAGGGLINTYSSLFTINAKDGNAYFSLGYINEAIGKIANWQTTNNTLEFDHFGLDDTDQNANYLLSYGGFVSNGRNSGAGYGMYWNDGTINIGIADFNAAASGTSMITVDYMSGGNVGIGNTLPSQRLDVTGNVKFSGALMPNNTAGTAGQVLTSAGDNIAPTWQTPAAATATAWGLLGNAGTNAATNFIGTTDDVDLVFKRFGLQSGLISYGNTSFGAEALNPLTTGGGNVAIGTFPLNKNTSGNYNMAIGGNALISNTTGQQNTAIGDSAMRSNTIGLQNVAIGDAAMYFNTTGQQNVAIGIKALDNNTTGNNNIALGYEANVPSATGSNQLNIGNSIYGTGMGTGAAKIGIGNNAPTEALDVTGNIKMASTLKTTGDMLFESNGVRAGLINSADDNTSFGNAALSANTAYENTAIGSNALANNTGGADNTTLGAYSLFGNIMGSSNTAIGAYAQTANESGYESVAVGYRAMEKSTTGGNNVGIGADVLRGLTTGSNNTAIGYGAGGAGVSGLTTGNYNIIIGNSVVVPSPTGSNQLNIGNVIFGTGLVNQGSFSSAPTGNIGIGTNAPSTTFHVKGASGTTLRIEDTNQGVGKILTSDANGVASWSSFGTSATATTSNVWGLKGNAGTAPGTNFIGTTDNQDVVFKRGGAQAGIIGSALTSLGIGSLALASPSLGYLTAVGSNALSNNTTGDENTAVGGGALSANSTGEFNTGIGALALGGNFTGSRNTALGAEALQAGSAIADNTAVGSTALKANQANYNTAVGSSALAVNTTGSTNTAVGASTLQNNTTAGKNSALGYGALAANTIGSENTAVGFNALAANVGLSGGNTAVGSEALKANSSGFNNVAIGTISMPASVSGSNNTALGQGTLQSLTSGSGNTALGNGAGLGITTGSQNLVVAAYGGTGQGVASNTGSNQMNIAGAIFGTGLTGGVSAPAGNIGIRNIAPAEALDVTGNIKLSGAINAGGTVGTSGQALISNGSTTSWANVKASDMSSTVTNQAASYALLASDAGGIVNYNSASAGNITLSALPIGSKVTLIQMGAGKATIVAGGGITPRNSLSLFGTRTQYSIITIQIISATEAIISGDVN